jgi:hypothetical protein
LWRVFDESGESAFPEHRRAQILQAFADLGDRNRLAPGENPVKV